MALELLSLLLATLWGDRPILASQSRVLAAPAVSFSKARAATVAF